MRLRHCEGVQLNGYVQQYVYAPSTTSKQHRANASRRDGRVIDSMRSTMRCCHVDVVDACRCALHAPHTREESWCILVYCKKTTCIVCVFNRNHIVPCCCVHIEYHLC